jgi:hypothetical protein
MMTNPPKKGKDMKKPLDKLEDKDTKKSFARTEKSVKPVAKDTNKTQRKDTLKPLKNAIRNGKTARTEGKKEGKMPNAGSTRR